MSVRVRIPTILRAQVGGAAEVAIDVNGHSATVRDLLSDLEGRYPGFARRILTDEGQLHRFVNLYVNDEDVRYIGSLEAEVKEGDTVSILPAVAGG
jgi:molybdopterin synthase sulfur carrier subunit